MNSIEILHALLIHKPLECTLTLLGMDDLSEKRRKPVYDLRARLALPFLFPYLREIGT